jgi:predicted membrane-bound mannosyltransferase
MAGVQQGGPGDEWRLGIDLGEPHEHSPAAEPQDDHDMSLARLTHPLHVVTVEHLGWAIIAAWALITRLIALGAPPLTAAEARNALFEYDLANRTHEAAAAGFHPAWSGWVHLLQAGIFTIGASDFSARLVFALSGLLLIAMAFEMRHYVGRAGAIGLGAMIAISPSATYFSRASTTVLPAAAFELVAIAAYMALGSQARVRRAIGFGCVAGLMMAADPTALVTTAIFIAALTILGVWKFSVTEKVYLQARVWLDRYANRLAIVIVVAVAVWGLSEFALFREISFVGIAQSFDSLRGGNGASGYLAGLRFYAPGFVFYEFLIVIAAIAGAITILTLRVRSRFAVFCLLWAAMSFAFYLWSPARAPDQMMRMIVPAAFLGAIAVDYLHHTQAWHLVRYVVAALALLTVYVQFLAIYCVPQPGGAPWARHGSLYWSAGATPVIARDRTHEIMIMAYGPVGTIWFNGGMPPSLRWYLRDLRPALSAAEATVVINADASPKPGDDVKAGFEYEESWKPNLATLDAARALRYLFTERIWGPVTTRVVNVTVRPLTESAPTVIVPPGAPP